MDQICKINLRKISAVIRVMIIFLIIFFDFYSLSPKVFSKESPNKGKDSIIDDEYIITFENETARSRFSNKHKKKILKEKKIDNNTYVYKINKNKDSLLLNIANQNIVNQFKYESGVKSVEPNHQMRSFVDPNDTYYNSQWHLAKIQGPAGWDVTQGLNTTVLAVIDTGVQLNHPDLNDKIWNNTGETGNTQPGDICWTGAPADKSTNNCDDDEDGYIDDWRGWDWINDDNNPTDDEGHGTAVSGTASAETNNSQGVAGVNWNAKIMPLKALNASGSGTEADLIAAINYARVKGAKVINMSLGADSYTQALLTAVNNAYNAGIVLVAASGNVPYCTQSGNIGVNWPAAFDNVIAVGSVSSSDIVSSFSCSGPELDVVAPGENIYSTLLNGSYGNAGSGTSFSAPQVAGLAGLILAKYPSATPSFVRNAIIRGASKVSGMGSSNFTSYYGYGRINIPACFFLLVKNSTSPLCYIINDGYKKPVKSANSFAYYGISWNNLEVLSQNILDAIPTGPPIGFLTKGSSPAVYLVSNNQKFWVPSYNRMQMWNYTWFDIQIIPDAALDRIPYGGELHILAKTPNDPAVYAMVGYADWVRYPDVWYGWGFHWNWIRTIDSATLVALPINPSPLGRLVKGSGPAIYFIDGGKKRLITKWNVYLRYAASYGGFLTISDALLGEIIDGSAITK